ncbi:hypothetical protein K438DRAFT_1807470 [Mycena galopus ATCC 62051]|nr:hypothetical protein K438DRAFT_1807470 [Mycena galopus ATCC 62051]
MALQSGLVSVPSSAIKSASATDTPCRTPTTTPLPDLTFLTSPLNLSGVACPPPRDRVDNASIHANAAISINTAETKDLLHATGGRVTSQQEEMAEGISDDLPPIAFLREPPASPTFSTRGLLDRAANTSKSGLLDRAADPSQRHTFVHAFAPGTSSAPFSLPDGRIPTKRPHSPVDHDAAEARRVKPASRTSVNHSSSSTKSHGASSSKSTLKPNSRSAFPAARSTRPSASAPASRHSSVVSHHGHASRDRTRAQTGAFAGEPAPRYKYTYNSLMRRPTATEPDHRGGTPAATGQRELEAVCEMAPAPVGVLPAPMHELFDVDAVVALVGGLRERDGMDVDTAGVGTATAMTTTQERWGRPCANTAPTAAYMALLEDAFGAGSATRGEGAKPMEALRPCKAPGKTKDRGRSTSSTSSDELNMEVVTDDSVDLEEQGSTRAQEWIAEINMVVKGKRQLVREVRVFF